MVRQGAIRRCQRISGIDDSGLAQCDPKQPVANNWFRDGQFAAARKFLEPLST